MKNHLLLLSLALLVMAGSSSAQTHATPAPIGTTQRMNIKDIEVLVTPIALYPDPLVALILPAATTPSDIVLAARFLERGGTPDAVASEQWDESVKALTRYREVINYLDEHLEWTRSLGDVFAVQPDDVMAAIQAVRTRAKAAGLLASNAQQEVVVEETIIEIVPAQPTVIYVPRYDPEILYVPRPSYFHSSFLSFGIGYSVGSWLNFDCDWRHRSIHVVHRPHSWYHQPDWRHRHHRHRPSYTWTRWSPSHRHYRHNGHAHRPYRPVHTVMPGRHRHGGAYRNDSHPTVAAARSDTVASTFHHSPQAQRQTGAHSPRTDRNTRPQMSNFDRRRIDDRNHRPASTSNGFAATPRPAPAAPVISAPAQPRFDRRNPSSDRPSPRMERPQSRPEYRQTRPHVATRPEAPRQRPNVTRPSNPPPPRFSSPPPQRPVAQAQRPSPPPRSSHANNVRRENAERGSRSDSLERSPRTQHAY